jgi:predicted PurR-regulated permease PerM
MLGFFVLVVTLWVVITKLALIFEVLGILFGALLLALGLDPLVKRMGRIRLPKIVECYPALPGAAWVSPGCEQPVAPTVQG